MVVEESAAQHNTTYTASPFSVECSDCCVLIRRRLLIIDPANRELLLLSVSTLRPLETSSDGSRLLLLVQTWLGGVQISSGRPLPLLA